MFAGELQKLKGVPAATHAAQEATSERSPSLCDIAGATFLANPLAAGLWTFSSGGQVRHLCLGLHDWSVSTLALSAHLQAVLLCS
jgi:hypothetical protein